MAKIPMVYEVDVGSLEMYRIRTTTFAEYLGNDDIGQLLKETFGV
jgi:hypothetical protein